MRGHIRKRSKDSWSLVIDIGSDPETGKRRQQWHTVRGSKRDAEVRLNEILNSLETGAYVKPNRVTVAEFFEDWLKNYVYVNCTAKTAEGYEGRIRTHIIPAIGNIQLSRLESRHIQNHYTQALTNGRADGTGGLSPRTVLQHHRIIHKALNYAVKQGIVKTNVADGVEPPRAKNKRMAVLSPDDVTQMLETSRGYGS